MTISLRTLLIVPFVCQVLGITGLVGYVSYRSGQQAVQAMASQLMGEMGQRVEVNLDAYLQVSKTLTRVNSHLLVGLADPTGSPQPAALVQLESHFLRQVQLFPSVTSLAMTTPSGAFLEVSQLPSGDTAIRHRNVTVNDDTLYHYQGDSMGQNRRLLSTQSDYDPHHDPPEYPWYRTARSSSQGFWRILVSGHQSPNQPILAIVRFRPVYDQRGEFRGVTSASILLPEVGHFLQAAVLQHQGQVLLLEPDGNMVATSTGEIPFITDVEGDLPPEAPAQYRQLAWYQSTNPLTRASVQHLIDQHVRLNHIQSPDFSSFWFESKHYFIQASPLQGELDGLLVTVIPSQAFMATIQDNLTRTLLLCALALLGSIGLGVWTAAIITKPILALQQATESFSQEAAPLPPGQPSHIKEVDALRQQFDQMVWQLVSSLQTLRHREDTLATFLNGVPVAVSVHAPDGHLLFLNQKGHELLPMGIVPTSLENLAQDYGLYRAGTDDLYPTGELPVAKGLRGKAAYTDDLEVMIDGQRIPLEVHTIPVLDEQGQVRYCINAFQDITERRQAEALSANYERELEQQVAAQTASIVQGEATKQALINAIPDLLMRLGREGVLLEIYNIDAVHWLGNRDTAQRRSMYEGLPAAIAAERQHYIELALTTGTIQRQEYELTIDDQKFWEEARIVPVTQDEVLVVVRDMSERHKIDRLKDEFIAMVSHELRTPLTAMRGALGILDSGVLQDRPDKARNMLKMSLLNTDRLIRLVNDILDLERLASGKVKLVREACQVDDLMRQAIEGVEALALEANIALHLCPLTATVWAAPDAIVQTLVNLLSNAIKFSEAESHIWLRAEIKREPADAAFPHPGTVLFSVADQGRGIPADQRDVIFDRFQQVDVSDSRQQGGTGLGLAICKSIITQHDGEIWVESTLGEGSTFYFTLPLGAHG